MKIRWLQSATRSRMAQLDYIAADNPEAAIRLYVLIERQIDKLGVSPEAGREGRVAGTREMVIAGTPFIVVYRVTMAEVEILRVLHGAQRWPPGKGA